MNDCLSLNATACRVAQLAREKEEKRALERRRHLVYLIAAFLREQGYSNTAESLLKEAQLSRDVHVCDNIDLETIILEYADYYYAKYNRYPKFCKKAEAAGNVTQNTCGKKERVSKVLNLKQEDGRAVGDECNNIGKSRVTQKHGGILPPNELNLGITVTPIFPAESGDRTATIQPIQMFDEAFTDNNERILKPIGNLYPAGSELKEIADVISREIVQQNLNVHWDDVKGLKFCKALLKEAIVYPMKYPTLFSGKLGACKGVLLYGPPGTGKTMLAKAVATECQSTFFNITSSSVISKWRGDSEKYIRVLTDLAKHYAPTIIFIDEIDWTTTKNADYASSSSEPARRFRAELLARLDGLLSMEYMNVILLAATNVPWNIDVALLRRLEKRIFVDLPDRASRLEILRFYVHRDLHESPEMSELVRETAGYSCADLKLLCKEAWMNQLRPVWTRLESKALTVNDIQNDGLINAMSHIALAKNTVKPIAKHMSDQYVKWHEEFGSFG
ncbi:PREDICTED: katanin p60 ATPase-containing subunit A-like 2 [Dinoponera quadriceps]|uniref:Katanin p60 ATPase-containing subunit A-like 2 n=1 Tax=Dinoponera quadriceps TaxID=609295 RepID=A0A6P3XZ24_DINQU|nr:PREDICTED: katanin p60 ATPase-containing subunit A-like 2 [Dinoponera quadriceps]XP_014483333.1 PREDICTED: katanin p60 ATPase-containing subunit A-like 2 [Dinoponera quadriceps]XP_014483334.1 PREDICTED: katanin p60 ATPase-containing subunit A-like 2 [Dinoponera quadriceps]XP_014483335.1 PREDICTED: katanin p60 ATPase-containing subunit A-like 2 [Dinoponera quadriceps]